MLLPHFSMQSGKSGRGRRWPVQSRDRWWIRPPMAVSCRGLPLGTGPSCGHLWPPLLPASLEWSPLSLKLPPFHAGLGVSQLQESEAVRKIRRVLREMKKPYGLYPNFLSPVTGNWEQREYRDVGPSPRPPPGPGPSMWPREKCTVTTSPAGHLLRATY
ncbi:Hypothetical predicted protein [Marmota monax]|uniref:Uncharacterized protein n=1 Tax=Marmota monax TaxID=9995 RepID=A0A5E4C9N1_MARMO|nr:Hypothetical predicted protein [Marmota monax]